MGITKTNTCTYMVYGSVSVGLITCWYRIAKTRTELTSSMIALHTVGMSYDLYRPTRNVDFADFSNDSNNNC